MNKLLMMGGAAAFAVCVGCATKCGAAGPAFENVKWEPTAFDSGVWTVDKDGVMTASKDVKFTARHQLQSFELAKPVQAKHFKLEVLKNRGSRWFSSRA